MAEGTLSPFTGFRIKTLSEELKLRAVRTLHRFLGGLLDKTGGKLPANFVVTLPKITVVEQVAALVEASGRAGDEVLGEIAPRNFSFNSPHGACRECTGLGVKMELDAEIGRVTQHWRDQIDDPHYDLSILQGTVTLGTSAANGSGAGTFTLGAGATRGRKFVRWSVVGNILGAWVLTLPAAAAIGGLSFFLLHLL